MTHYLLDSDAVIDILKGYRFAVELVARLYEQGDIMCTCDVVIAEAYTGLHPHQRVQGEPLLESLRFLPTSRSAARQAGLWRYEFARRGRQLTTTDCLNAAIAVEHQATIVTGNIRDYPMNEVILLPLPRGR